MLNNEKIQVMTRLAVFEQKKGKEDIKLSRYFKNDFIRYHLLKNVVSVTLGLLIVAAMVVLYRMEYIIANIVTLDYKAIGRFSLVVYIIVLTVYIFYSIILLSYQYNKSRKKLSRYFKDLKKLQELYAQEEAEQW